MKKIIGNLGTLELQILIRSNSESSDEWDREWLNVNMNINFEAGFDQLKKIKDEILSQMELI